ncbi:hypothetical protein ED733_006153 [Metarhizium rileyi]|uniref:Xylanolytic transcriptional activator regulatory domain-containing protein n=1 Tax=Metarhizium rileyi (strain RCEF 4871) TaxID=1649241 RepID=A0A5C6GIA9_METRR|nr:hypothetical protein ED733_006153 [Metarhizium rileyi]
MGSGTVKGDKFHHVDVDEHSHVASVVAARSNPFADDSEQSRGLDVLSVRSQAPALAASPTPSGNTDPCSPDTSAVGLSHHDSRSTSRALDLIPVSHFAGETIVGLPSPTSSSRKGGDHHDQENDARGPLLQSILQKLQILEESSKKAHTLDEGTLQRQGQDGRPGEEAGKKVSQRGGEHAGEHPGEPPGRYPGGDAGQDERAPKHWQVTLNKSRDLGKRGWTESAPEFAAIIACWVEVMGKSSGNAAFRDPQVAALVEQAGDFLSKCKHTAKSIKLLRPTRALSLSSPDWLVPPPRETCDTLANLYFDSFESAHRILHVPTFWADYRKYWDYPDSNTTSSRLTIFLVIAIGSSLFDYATPEAALRNAEMVHHWIYAAETWLAGPLEKDRVHLVGLQIYCLTLLARQIFSIGGDTVWMSTGSLLNRAMQIGLHRDPRNLPGKPISPLQAEVRRRLWATIIELVLQASLDSRMPPRISSDEFDTQPPSNLNDVEIDESTTVLPPHHADRFTNTSVQLALLGSFSVRLRILKLMNRINAETSYQQVLARSAELTDALHVSSMLMRDNPGSAPFHRNMLDYLVRRFMIPLHFFFSNQARTNPVYYYSLKLSLDAATAIMSPEPDAGFSRLMASGGGLFREGLRVASIAVGLGLLVHVQTQRLDGTLRRTSDYRNLQKQAIRDMVSLFEERIRQGETNVKGHMFLSMILGQVNAIEEDSMVELQLARSARDSLEYCCGVLRARADRTPSATTPLRADAASSVGTDGSLTDVDGYVMDLDWESFFPDQAFINAMTA